MNGLIFALTFGLVLVQSVMSLDDSIQDDPILLAYTGEKLGLPTTSFHQQGRTVCMDVYKNCKTWAKKGACKSSKYTTDAKRALCGVSCNLCSKSSNDGNSGGSDQLSRALAPVQKPLFELINNLNEIVKVGKAKLTELMNQKDD
ncbi:hypothetical protein M3Y98_00118500 [Aphelenchoides besseyi]|nr:hypothetical protein M3Y98_00118500 [Aphelenchoides besseyi]KAI6199483.1 hypothetical protein M3Y96_00631900 [Aphelenchoides besseyi]